MSLFSLFGDAADVVWQAIRLGLQFNPVFAVVGAAIAAGLLGYRKAPRERMFWAGSVIVVAWLAGDGLRVLARARDAYDGATLLNGTPVWGTILLLALWAVVSVVVGYLLPTWAGITVGRRVTHGTGWLAAMSIAVGASLGLSSLIAALGVLG
ncbi:MAG: hypothetical protein Q8S43_09875 [Actinomycetota bacterium]|nr:MAG: hypothetical protein FD171_89 [Actinomycetota bacterium]MDO8950659.1 hypothetical protein [Actinomycetota bacterium]MDP3631239.1 hypothetical protein [Actinomycetota bacterium]MDZ4232254.1 hypothetical protein [Dietzia sp.]